MEKPWDLRQRTILFAVSTIRFCRSLPRSAEAAEIASQLRRSSGSIGAHYVAATRNKSDSDYIAKMTGGIEEADESTFWLDVLIASDIAREPIAGELRHEADELAKIFLACRSTAIERQQRGRATKLKRGSVCLVGFALLVYALYFFLPSSFFRLSA